MGLSISWVAVRGLDRTEVLAALDMVDTGRPAPDYPVGVGLAETAPGWVVLLSDDLEFATPDVLEKLSVGGVALSGQEDERTMFSQARRFADGVETWRLTHEPEKGLRHLDVSGEPPDAYAAALAQAGRDQDAEPDDEVDFFFDVPLQSAAAECGLRPMNPDYPDLPYTVLRSASAAQSGATEVKPRGFLARLFGR